MVLYMYVVFCLKQEQSKRKCNFSKFYISVLKNCCKQKFNLIPKGMYTTLPLTLIWDLRYIGGIILKEELRNKDNEHVWYERLYLEMKLRNITYKHMEKLLNIDKVNFESKINGITHFTLDEAEKIQQHYFPTLAIEILFATTPIFKYNPVTNSYIVKNGGYDD